MTYKILNRKYAEWLPRLRRKLKMTKYAIHRSQHFSQINNYCSNKQIDINKYSAPWRVLFFGTDIFALESLRKLENQYRLNLLINRLEIVTSYKGTDNKIIKFAEEHNLKIHKWPINDKIIDFDIGIVVSFGHLIPSSIIHSFPLGMINVHGSLLPRWRGAAPIIHALIHGDTKTGVSIMRIRPKKFDIGEVLTQKVVDIGPDERQPELHNKLSIVGAELLLEVVEKLPNILNEAKPQSNDGLTYAPKITRDNVQIKWSEMSAKNVHDLERAFTGIYPLVTTFQGKSIKLHGVKIVGNSSRLSLKIVNNNDTEITPGLLIFDKSLDLLRIQCSDGEWVSIEEVTLANHKRMRAKDFDNGFVRKKLNKVMFGT